MSNITKIVFTDLFWETLSDHRKHGRYADFRKAIVACIQNKANDRNFTSKSDKPFSGNPVLRGLWHCKLSRNPDVVFFYRMDGDTMLCGMIGDHHDYGFNGKNQLAEQVLAGRINQAISRGHQEIAGWSGVKWNKPSDLLHHPELSECSDAELHRLQSEIESETVSLSKLEMAYGSCNELPDETWSLWLEELHEVHVAISKIQEDRALRHLHRASFRSVMAI